MFKKDEIFNNLKVRDIHDNIKEYLCSVVGVFSLRNSTQAKLSVLQPDMTCGSVACTRNGRDTTGNTIFIYSRLEFKMAIGTSTQCKAQCVARLAW